MQALPKVEQNHITLVEEDSHQEGEEWAPSVAASVAAELDNIIKIKVVKKYHIQVGDVIILCKYIFSSLPSTDVWNNLLILKKTIRKRRHLAR